MPVGKKGNSHLTLLFTSVNNCPRNGNVRKKMLVYWGHCIIVHGWVLIIEYNVRTKILRFHLA